MWIRFCLSEVLKIKYILVSIFLLVFFFKIYRRRKIKYGFSLVKNHYVIFIGKKINFLNKHSDPDNYWDIQILWKTLKQKLQMKYKLKIRASFCVILTQPPGTWRKASDYEVGLRMQSCPGMWGSSPHSVFLSVSLAKTLFSTNAFLFR